MIFLIEKKLDDIHEYLEKKLVIFFNENSTIIVQTYEIIQHYTSMKTFKIILLIIYLFFKLSVCFSSPKAAICFFLFETF